MNDAPRVSVLMTVYNAEQWLREAVGSLVAQRFTDWELIAIENGSTDESRVILEACADERIRLVALPSNIGRTPALRQAFDFARGEYIAVLDADDVARSDRLERQVAHLDTTPDAVLVGSWARYIDERGVAFRYWRPPADREAIIELLGWANPIVHSSAMYRAALARDVGGYPLERPYAQDCGLWLRLAARGAVDVIPEELCDQRILAASMTRESTFRAALILDGMALAREARDTLALSGRAAQRNRDAIMIAGMKWGLTLLRSGRPVRGLFTLLRAALANPMGLVRSRGYRTQYLHER
jgi:hypothetical protein